MLSMNSYPPEYIESSRRHISAQVEAYRTLAAAASKAGGKAAGPARDALESFEPQFFNVMVLVLESHFVHRSRTMEKKDGNPLNEVRVVATSLMENDGILRADKSIKLDPAKSVLKLEVGDQIALGEADFVLLTDAFFAELEKKYT